jgi:hypothetical protein
MVGLSLVDWASACGHAGKTRMHWFDTGYAALPATTGPTRAYPRLIDPRLSR